MVQMVAFCPFFSSVNLRPKGILVMHFRLLIKEVIPYRYAAITYSPSRETNFQTMLLHGLNIFVFSTKYL